MGKITGSMNQLGKNERILLSSLFVIAVITIYWFTILGPAVEKLTPTKTSIANLKKKISDTSKLNSEIKKSQNELLELKVKYEDATKVVPKTDRYPQLTKELRAMVTSSGLVMTSNTLGEPKVFIDKESGDVSATQEEPSSDEGGLQTMLLDINIDGSDYSKILSLVGKIEEDKRIVEVQKVSMSDKATTISLLYYISGGNEKEEYDFNTGVYGKDNIFN